MSLWNTLKETEREGIEEVYRLAYYAIANQLIENGYKEAQARELFQQAVVFLVHKVKENDFDPDTDITLYLSTLIKGLTKDKQ